MVICSENYLNYINSIEEKTHKAYSVAETARAKGFDPEDKVDIPLAADVAERCVELVGAVSPEIIGKGIAERIRELEEEYSSSDWRVAFIIGAEVAKEKFCEFESKEKAIETGVRIGLAFITMGVTCAPLEGFIELRLKDRRDGKGKYCAVYYAGPIRSAGGTASAVSALIADYVRKECGVLDYDPSPKEVKRYFAELRDYHERVSRLQYFGNEEEIDFLVNHIPVELNGDPTSRREVSNYKRLPRVETDFIRGGMCLVLGEGMCLKAKKIIKRIKEWGESMGMNHWLFMEDYIKLQKKIHSKSDSSDKEEEDDSCKVKPNHKFIEELVAGRPVFTHPMAHGGFRLRYGRCRLSGLASASMHPATMRITDDFIATGVQLKVERPGKACAITPCDTVRGPIVKLKNGDVVEISDEEDALEIRRNIKEVIFLGDILFCYGDFVENGSNLVPPGYVPEWWILELKKNISDVNSLNKEVNVDLEDLFNNPLSTKLSLSDAALLSDKTGAPLYPGFVFFWKNIENKDLKKLISVLSDSVIEKDSIVIKDLSVKKILEDLWVVHKLSGNKIMIEEDIARALLLNLGYSNNNVFGRVDDDKSVLENINSLSEYVIKDIGGVFVGARMGRPEKAKLRKMTGRPHGLFPVGREGGRLRSFNKALEEGRVSADFPLFFCSNCKIVTVYRKCENCGEKTIKYYYCPKCEKIGPQENCCSNSDTQRFNKRSISIKHYVDNALKKINMGFPSLVKGVRGVMNKDKLTENFTKVLLRAKNNIHVNKDGTVRYDIIETCVTHFRPSEINTSVEKLNSLGYTKDVKGNPLNSSEQLVELKAQDVILPDCSKSEDMSCAEMLINTCSFVDDELEYLYNLPRFYNISSKDELVGELIISIAPHTSAGIISRIIGFSKSQGFYAHPYLHAACRRNADGDELGLILLLDGLLNFSRQYLPDRRGGRTMDAPLVLSVKLDPLEIDDEAFNVDIANYYPLSFYNAALECKMPWEVSVEKVEDRLGTDSQFEGLGFTHDTKSMNSGPLISAYRTLASMDDKVKAQMNLAKKLRAVRENHVAELIINKHFMKDLKGNLRKFSQQRFRCVDCNKKYRRPPLLGKCESCGGKILLTIHEGSVIKYFEPSIMLSEEFDINDYLKQDLMILQRKLEGLFGKDPYKQVSLSDF